MAHPPNKNGASTVEAATGPDRVGREAPACEAAAWLGDGGKGDGGTAHTEPPGSATPGLTDLVATVRRSSRARRQGTPGAVVGAMSEDNRAAVRAAVLALAPLSDEQIAGVCEVITNSRQRWHHLDTPTG
jgi:hypothetical protein